MQDFRNLEVWEKVHHATLLVYKATVAFPSNEMYGLTSQLRRSAASTAANIAEGCGRGGDADFARFLQMAMGSAAETEYHLLLARDLGYMAASAYDSINEQVCEVKRMLASLMRKVRSGA
jgi:four helix bundle protein